MRYVNTYVLTFIRGKYRLAAMRKELKTAQLQIRVSAEEKHLIAQAAQRAGMDMSSYVLERILGVHESHMQELMHLVGNEMTRSYGYAELNDFLVSLTVTELRRAVANRPFNSLPPEVANYVTAMIEQACVRAGIGVPAWTQKIKPLSMPVFGSQLSGLRLHLLANSPPPFKRRNVFIDTSIGGRV
jgi:hypothetical protein